MLVVFDLDGTLAKVGEGAEAETVALLHKIRETGARIALSSGKPTFYLCAFARQLGIQDAVLVGENGSVIQVGTALPPTVYHKAKIPVITKEALKTLREMLEEEFGDRIWYQPNETALTPFPTYQEDFPKIRAILECFLTPEMEIKVYEHPDCFDIQYRHLSKGAGIQRLAQVTGIPPEQMISVGDYTNDYPMFAATGYSVGIHLPDPSRASINFPTTLEALTHVLEKLRSSL